MSVEQDSIERIRAASLPVARRGYDKQAVDRFLGELADWLETGGADEARVDLISCELERVGQRISVLLVQAHEIAESTRAEAAREAEDLLATVQAEAETARSAAERSATSTRSEADAYAERSRIETDSYADETRAEADAYAERVRSEASAEATETRRDADQHAARVHEEADAIAAEARERGEREAQEARAAAQAEAARTVDEANRRRDDLEATISDLEARRDAVVVELERLSGELIGTATEHRPDRATTELQAVEEEGAPAAAS